MDSLDARREKRTIGIDEDVKYQHYIEDACDESERNLINDRRDCSFLHRFRFNFIETQI